MRTKAIILITLNLLAQLADGLLTWVATPDLAMEGNPLVLYFHLGWGALFFANALFFLLYAALIWYSYARYNAPIFQAGKPTEYVSMLLFGRPDCFRWVFYRLRNAVPGGRLDVAVCLVLFFALFIRWFAWQYRRSQAAEAVA